MSQITTEQLEGIIWPKYQESVSALSGACWDIAKKANGKLAQFDQAPGWFTEILEVQVKALLNLVFSAPYPWVVLPEPIEGFCIVMYKTPRGAVMPIKQSKIELKNHTFDQFSEFAKLVEKTLVKILKGYMSANGDVIEMENEDGVVYLFPKAKTEAYLLQLGFLPEQIPKLIGQSSR